MAVGRVKATEPQMGCLALTVSDFNEIEPYRMNEARLPRRVIRAARNPSSHEDHLRGHEETVEFYRIRGANALALGEQFLGELLVGIEVEHPRVAKRNLLMGMIA